MMRTLALINLICGRPGIVTNPVLAIALLIALIGSGSCHAANEQAVPPTVIPPERRPYDVRVLMSIDPLALDESAARNLIKEFDQYADKCVGDLWILKSRAIEWLAPTNAEGLKRLDQSFLTTHCEDEVADVWFVASIEPLPFGSRVSVRSWQPEVRTETTVISVDVQDPRELAVAILRLCRELFRPMGVLEQATDKSVRIRLRAGELIAPDASFAQLTTGELLLPLLAYRDKNKVIEKLQPIPWTYITVDSVDASTVMGTVQSGLRLAVGGKKRGRIDTLIVAVRPQSRATRIELTTQSKPIVPLIAHRIEVRTLPIIPRPTEAHPEIDPSSTLVSELITDRRGMARVSVDSKHSLVWMFAYSGQNLLARVPFVPGIVREARLEVPDDATRLAAEADLQMLQGEVIDAVALRNTGMATIRAAAKKDDWKTVNQKLDLLKRQQAASTFVDRLTAIRVAGSGAAKARKDKLAEARINRMCDEALTLIDAHLSSEKVRLLIEEMEAMQEAERDADEPQPKAK